MAKKELKMKCRAKWGASWWKVHPVIKKARLAWAEGKEQSVRVQESGEVYFC